MAKKSFEAQLARLEEIVEILDRGEEPLEKMLDYYEEGMELSKNLRKFLDKAELKVMNIAGRENDDEESDTGDDDTGDSLF